MLKLPPQVRVFLAVTATDMRKQFDGLSILVREGMKREPKSGDLYVFRNRRSDIVKILFFDRQGYCLLAKRLDKGVFKMGVDADGAESDVEITAFQLAELLSSMSFSQQPSVISH